MKTFADHLVNLGFRESGFELKDAQYGRTCQVHLFQGKAYFRSQQNELKNIKQFWVPAADACTGYHFRFPKKLAYLANQRLPGISGRILEAGFAFFQDKKPLLFQNFIHADLTLEDVKQIDFNKTVKVTYIDEVQAIVYAEWYQTIARFELFTFSYCDLVELDKD